MSLENVIPFETLRRRAMARRGAADKTYVTGAAEIDCPFCATTLYLDASVLTAGSEVFCSACRGVIECGGPETAGSRN